MSKIKPIKEKDEWEYKCLIPNSFFFISTPYLKNIFNILVAFSEICGIILLYRNIKI